MNRFFLLLLLGAMIFIFDTDSIGGWTMTRNTNTLQKMKDFFEKYSGELVAME